MSDSETKAKQYPPIGWPGRADTGSRETLLHHFDVLPTDFPVYKPQGEWQQWLPSINIKESEEAFHIAVELPGVKKEDVRVTLENDILRISADRRFEDKRASYHAIEHRYGAFSRSLSFPVPVSAAEAEATLEHGILTIRVQKAGTAVEPREIPKIPIS